MSSIVQENQSRVGTMFHAIFCRTLPLEKETSLFILVSAIDLFMTYILLRHEHAAGGRFYESNPIADYFISGWGLRGMVYFKFMMVGVIALICQWIACQSVPIARTLLQFATVAGGTVVLYSLSLFLRHGGLL